MSDLNEYGRVSIRWLRAMGVLLRDVAAYILRLSHDLLSAAQLLWLDRQARRAEARLDLESRKAEIRTRRSERWSSWRALPGSRRLLVRSSAALLAVAAMWALRQRDDDPGPASRAALAAQQVEPSASETSQDQEGSEDPKGDLEAAAIRFEREIESTRPGEWIALSEPALAAGPQDAWDDFSVSSPWVIRGSPSGPYWMWYRGCYLRGGDRACAIGMAESDDGIRWRKRSEPVLSPELSEDLAYLTAVRRDDRFLLWYSLEPNWFGGRRSSTLHLATSANGKEWADAGPVLSATMQTAASIEPAAVWDGLRLHLWFVDSLQRSEKHDHVPPDGGPFLVHFTSRDGKAWEESVQFPLGDLGLESPRVTAPVADGAGWRALLYAGLDFGDLVSADGETWEARRSLGRLASDLLGEGSELSPGRVFAMPFENGRLFFVVVATREGRQHIRLAYRGE